MKETEAKDARESAKLAGERLVQANRLCKQAIDTAQRQHDAIEEERAEFRVKEAALAETLERMKEAWTTREAEWQMFNKRSAYKTSCSSCS